jgi:kynurenine formamidase
MRFVDRGVPSNKEDVMGTTVIGVDPHKRSHTAVVLDDDEEIAAQLRVVADRRQVHRLLAWANDWPERIWAVENVNGLGRLLAQQLVRRGEIAGLPWAETDLDAAARRWCPTESPVRFVADVSVFGSGSDAKG